MALIAEFTEKDRASNQDPARENMTQSKRLLTYLQKNLLFEQSKLNDPVKENKAQIEEEIARDLQYLNVFIQPIQNINIFDKDRAQSQSTKREDTLRGREEGQGEAESQTLDDQLRDLILNSPLRPLVDKRILELQSTVETKDMLAAKMAFTHTFQ